MNEGLLSGLQGYLETGSLFAYLIIFLGGVLASFTPCVYPVIPITVSYVGAQSQGSRLKGFFLSLFYVLGMAVTYACLGAFAALTGRIFGQVQTNPWIYLVIANIFILLGLSLLEVYRLPLPGFLSRPRGGQKTRKGFLGSFSLGLASGFVLGPCTAPILAVLLAYVASRQNLVFGITMLFTFALGMGVLLIVLGTFVALVTSLPAAGSWMVRIKKFFGWAFIVLGEYFLIKSGSLLI